LKRYQLLFCLIVGLGFAFSPGLLHGAIHHDLGVRLIPGEKSVEVVDTVTVPAALFESGGGKVHALLHGKLALDTKSLQETREVKAELSDSPVAAHFDLPKDAFEKWGIPVQEVTLTRKGGAARSENVVLTFRYRGVIYHAPASEEEEYDKSFERSPGIVSDDGVVLNGASLWYPSFAGNDLLTFRLRVDLPEGWDAVSQGRRTRHETADRSPVTTWESPDPMDEIFLIAGRFTEYTSETAGGTQCMVFLREPDPALAAQYLDATDEYLTLFSSLFGPYPYPKFALVENFWETGYGMPSFTLLGSKVIRFPFIIQSSYPHEILHNWWGNSVYVDYESGNWCEGLTTYLADYLIKERQGQGALYRRDTLQKYTSYVTSARDFPLKDFRERHSSATAAVGYGKSMMMFHMLRRMTGDEAFLKALRQFYASMKFKRASFADIRRSFEAVTGGDLGWFFDEWVGRVGAPRLTLREPRVIEEGNRFKLSFLVEQTQKEEPFRLQLPVAIALDGEEKPICKTLEVQEKQKHVIEGPYDKKPYAVALDPAFDLFRTLDYREVPPSLGQMYGAEKALVVLPTGEGEALGKAYADLADSWAKSKQAEVVIADDAKVGPGDLKGRAVWVLGAANRLRERFLAASSGYEFSEEGAGFRLEGRAYDLQGNSCVVSARNPEDPEKAITWLFADPPGALPGLARKLPHYSKYSYLVFEGSEPKNIAKGQWPVKDSPLVAFTEGGAAAGTAFLSKLPPERSLAALAPNPVRAALLKHVQYLASDALEGRGLGSAGLDLAAGYIAREFEEAGLKPAGDGGTFYQSWEEKSGPEGKMIAMKNVAAVVPGSNPALGPVIVGAHYDHLGRGWPDVHEADRGRIHPGADDNASGVAVMLQLASSIGRKAPFPRSVVFVAFTGEEAGRLGSKHFVKTLESSVTPKPIAMVNLDTVGRLQGREILALGAGTGDGLEPIVRGVGYVTGVAVKPTSGDPGGSDQVSFIEKGIPAIQLFTGPHEDYHRPTDTVERIDAKGMLDVLRVTDEIVKYMAGRDTSIVFTGAGAEPPPAGTPSGGTRRVSLGTIPDFSYSEGCRISGVRAGSPAERAGLQAGDVILQIGETPIASLRDLSEALKARSAGDTVTVTFQRGDEKKSVPVTLEAR
jgi:aminopeptidase N